MLASRILSVLKGRVALAAIASMLTLLAVGGVMYVADLALAGDDGSTIYGCVRDRNGQLRVVDGPSDCNRNETPIDWNREGPPGPPGGVTTEIRTVHGVIDPREWSGVSASCEEGQVVTGGGYAVGSIGFSDKVNLNAPTDERTWTVEVFNNTDLPLDVWVSAICAQSAG